MLKIASVAMIVTTLLGCKDYGTGEDTHPNAPQQPGPERGGPPIPRTRNPEPHEGDPNPSGEHYIYVRAGGIEEPGRPWTLTVTAKGASRFTDVREIVTGENHPTVRIPYTDDEKPIYVTVEVKPARPGSKKGYCSIEAPGGHDGPRFIAGGWRAQCYLTVD